MNKILFGKIMIGVITGYLATLGLWYIVLSLNEIFYPGQFTELWRFLLWELGIGTFAAITFGNLFSNIGENP